MQRVQFDNDFTILEWIIIIPWLMILTAQAGVCLWLTLKFVMIFAYSVYETLRITWAIV